MNDRIIIDTHIQNGKLVIKGTRPTVVRIIVGACKW